MYEHISYPVILERLMKQVSEADANLDTRIASIIFSSLAPAAVELVNMYIEADAVLNETFADTASWDFLVRRCAERGVFPKEASAAVWQGLFDADPPIGARFSAGKLNFAVTGFISVGRWQLVCETVGEVGNSAEPELIPIEYVPRLTEARLEKLLVPGEDLEDIEHLRKRYYESFESQAFGGNIADYKQKVNAMPGVGDCKIHPVWNGGGTVKVVVINSAWSLPSAELVDTVQFALDPPASKGEGVGLAPIGHVVTVEGVKSHTVDIETAVVCEEGVLWEDLAPYAGEAVDSYFEELSRTWADIEKVVVRISQIETRLLAVDGIIDIAHTKLDGAEENLTLDTDEIPVRGKLDG